MEIQELLAQAMEPKATSIPYTPSPRDNRQIPVGRVSDWEPDSISIPKEVQESAARLLSPPYCPEIPRPKQAAFLLDFSKEVLYGGAAFGGKSSSLLMAALQFVSVPGYSAILFRKTYADLTKSGALMDRSHAWLDGTDAKFDDRAHAWRFPSGATLAFGNLEVERMKYSYQSMEVQFVGFDELTQFGESEYRYLFSRLRRPLTGPLSQVPLRQRSATNPGGIGAAWVRRRFIVPWKLWRDGKAPKPDRNFIPSTLDDLRDVVDADTYEQFLRELPSVEYSQLRYGDWEIRAEGRMFDPSWFKTVPRGQVPNHCIWLRYWDLASTEKKPGRDPDYSCGTLLGRDPTTGQIYVTDVRRFRESPATTEALVLATAHSDGYGVPIYLEQEPGSSGRLLIDTWTRHGLQGFTVSGVPSTGSKVIRAEPLRSSAEKGHLVLVEGWEMVEWLDEIESFPDAEHDDCVDSLSGAFSVMTRKESRALMVAPVSMAQENPWRV